MCGVGVLCIVGWCVYGRCVACIVCVFHGVCLCNEFGLCSMISVCGTCVE